MCHLLGWSFGPSSLWPSDSSGKDSIQEALSTSWKSPPNHSTFMQCSSQSSGSLAFISFMRFCLGWNTQKEWTACKSVPFIFNRLLYYTTLVFSIEIMSFQSMEDIWLQLWKFKEKLSTRSTKPRLKLFMLRPSYDWKPYLIFKRQFNEDQIYFFWRGESLIWMQIRYL